MVEYISNFTRGGPDNTDEDDGDSGGEEGGLTPIGFSGYGGFERVGHSGLNVYNRGDDAAPTSLEGGRLVLASSLPGGRRKQ